MRPRDAVAPAPEVGVVAAAIAYRPRQQAHTGPLPQQIRVRQRTFMFEYLRKVPKIDPATGTADEMLSLLFGWIAERWPMYFIRHFFWWRRKKVQL